MDFLAAVAVSGAESATWPSASAKTTENNTKSFQTGFIEFIEPCCVIGYGISMT
jgi:hypothetical protein